MAPTRAVWTYRAALAWLALLALVGLGAALYFAFLVTLAVAGVLAGLLLTISAVICVEDGNPAKKTKEREARLDSERNHVW